MALTTVGGIYRNGEVELYERPGDIREAPVLVIFLPQPGAENGTSASRDDAANREAARQRAFARMRAGIPRGGPPYPSREELHERGDR